jgi:tape measure domain-containing protein
MAGEIHTIGMNIDASGAKRGAATYAAAINKIAQATRDFDKMSASLGKNMGKSGAFAAVARDLNKLNSLRVNPALAKNVQALSAALSSFKGPSSRAVSNTRTLMRDLGNARINSTTTRGLSNLTSAMNAYRGPSRGAAQNTKAFFSALAGARVSSGIASGLSAVSNAMSGFKTMGSGSVRNFQTFVATINSLRVPPGIAQLGSAMSALTGRFGSGQAAALRFGGSVNGIPWGRASAGAVQLTGNLRGLENAMSLSYQMGSQLRVLFGALTVSGFTSSVIEATTSAQRLETVLGAIGMDTQTVADQMQFATDVAYKYGISLLDVQKEFGRFSASAGATGLSLEQTGFVFESLAANMRLFGLDAAQQALAIKAVTQMFQKGSVQAEEFKNQLGDQMPGAFEALRRVLVRLTGDAKVDPMEYMRKGMLDSDIMIDVMEEMNNMFGKGFAAASDLAVASMQNLRSAWTEFLNVVGGSGVMDALGDVSKQLTAIIKTEEFQQFGREIGEGLGNAIRKVGTAAAFLLTHIREVAQVIGVLLGGKAIHTAMQLGSAFSVLGSAVTGTAGKVMGLVASFGKLGTGMRLVPALAGAVGMLGGAFGIAAVAGGAALALLWNETVKVGDATTTVGSMAMIAFQDFGNWATWAGGQVVTMFTSMAGIAGQWFEAMNQSVTGGAASWEDWGKAVLGVVVLIGNTMIDVFRTAWRLVVQNTLDAFSIIMDTVKGINAAFQMVGALGRFNGSEAAAWAREAGAAFGRAGATGEKAFQETTDVLNGTFANAAQRTEEYLAGIDWVSTAWDGSKESMVNYFTELANRAAQADADAAAGTPPADAPFSIPTLTDRTGLTPLKTDDDAKALGRLGKAADDAKEALAAFAEEQMMLDQMLASGKINATQYADALSYYKGKLEETVDPYSAMIRSMQEENNLLRLNGREQRTASEFMERKNQLLEQGVVLTDQQTQALKAMIAEQDKLKNPGPLQSWVNNMETAADAIESAGVRAMESLSDNIADMIVEGKADWASLAKQILKDLIKIGLNEVWKGMFGGNQAQQPVNAPMTGAAGQNAMGALGSAATDTIPGMASAVAQGIQMAGGGMGAGILGNDIGGGAGPFSDLQNVLSGKPGTGALPNALPGGSSAINSLTGAGFGVGGMGNAPVMSDFTTALPQATVQAAASPLTQAATAMAGATQAMNETASAVQSGYEAINSGMSNFATSAFGGGTSAPPVPVSVETIATYPTTGVGIPPSLGGAGYGVPGVANPNISDFVSNLGGGSPVAGGPHSAFTNGQGGNIRDFLAAGKSNSHADGLDPEFQRRIEAMFSAPDAPPGLEIFSGHRSIERQQELWDEALRKYGSPEAARKWVAPPGRSSHNFGKAIDVGQNGSTFSGMDPEAQQWLHDNAGKYGMKFPLSNEGWHMEMQETRGGAPFTGQLPGVDPMTTQGIPGMGGMSQAGVTPGMPGSMQPQMGGMMSGYGAGMMPGGGMGGMGMGGMMQPMPPTLTAAGMGGGGLAGGLPGGMGMPGAAGMGGMGGSLGGGLAGLGDQVKAELTPAFQQVATTIPQQFDPAMGQVAQQLPQKFTEQGDQFGQQLLSAAQPGNLQAAQDNAQKYQEANTQAANDFAMKMQQAGGGGGGMGGMLGGGGGGGGGLGGIMGIFGSFFKTGGIVGQSGKPGKAMPASTWSGARSMRTGGIVGDPDAEPIIAHKGELVVPAHEVDRMRRMGMDTSLIDNAAVKSAKKSRPGAGVAQDGGEYMGVMARGAGSRPIINYNITTPDANSFKASQGQIQAKAGAAAYRDAVRNN